MAPEWHLTYGQSAIILYSGGIGAIVGALLFGAFADAWGRKPQVVAATAICALGSGLIAFIPDSAWFLFAVLRFFVGLGLSGAVAPSITIIVELTPMRYRTMVTSFYLVFFSVGGLLAPIASAALMGPFGWRGVALLGFVALVIAILVAILTPESVRWLTAKGRFKEAQVEISRYLNVSVGQVPLPSLSPDATPRGNLFDLLRHPRIFLETILIWGGSSIAMYGIYLWGPTIVASLLGLTISQAALYFLFVSAAGVGGKLIVTVLAPLVGRRWVGTSWGLGGAGALAFSGYASGSLIGGVPLMIILLCMANFCVEGGFANLAPYTIERYGVNLGARATGLGQMANGFGKIIGPLSLALIAGTGNFVTREQTAAAVFPTFFFLACCMVPVGLSFLLLGVETHGKAIALDAKDQS